MSSHAFAYGPGTGIARPCPTGMLPWDEPFDYASFADFKAYYVRQACGDDSGFPSLAGVSVSGSSLILEGQDYTTVPPPIIFGIAKLATPITEWTASINASFMMDHGSLMNASDYNLLNIIGFSGDAAHEAPGADMNFNEALGPGFPAPFLMALRGDINASDLSSLGGGGGVIDEATLPTVHDFTIKVSNPSAGIIRNRQLWSSFDTHIDYASASILYDQWLVSIRPPQTSGISIALNSITVVEGV